MKTLHYIIGIVLLFLATSCAMTESLILNDNGSGIYSLDLDASELMALGGNKSTSDKPQIMDSIISFKDILAEKKDSIAKLSPEEQERIKKMENFNMRLVMNEPEGVMKYSMFIDFKQLSELNEVTSNFKEIASKGNSFDKQMGGMGSMMGKSNSKVTFNFNGNSFSKKVEVVTIDESEVFEVLEEPIDTTETENYESEESLTEGLDKSMEMILEQTKFKIKYTFPKPVKKVHSPYEVFYSDDRKTITIEMPLKDYMNGVDKSNLEVEF